jgi:hypothetical protein
MSGYIRKTYIGLIALGVVLVLAVTFFFQAATIYSSQVIAKPAGEPIGIAPFTDRIDFGDVPQGERVGKTLIMENEGAVPNKINVFIIGNIGDLVDIQPDSLSLQPGETAEIDFNLTMPASAQPEKKYTGRIIILRLPQSLF